jgi:hypothetical protein
MRNVSEGNSFTNKNDNDFKSSAVMDSEADGSDDGCAWENFVKSDDKLDCSVEDLRRLIGKWDGKMSWK